MRMVFPDHKYYNLTNFLQRPYYYVQRYYYYINWFNLTRQMQMTEIRQEQELLHNICNNICYYICVITVALFYICVNNSSTISFT